MYYFRTGISFQCVCAIKHFIAPTLAYFHCLFRADSLNAIMMDLMLEAMAFKHFARSASKIKFERLGARFNTEYVHIYVCYLSYIRRL